MDKRTGMCDECILPLNDDFIDNRQKGHSKPLSKWYNISVLVYRSWNQSYEQYRCLIPTDSKSRISVVGVIS